ncbi:MAG: N-acetylmuramoyl-L-alanine amidase, partial [Flavobacteriales bacterium]|nr:N-acetylmuramoyl-L-alanine amidase [Flavobacteriales bacterium]
MHLKTTILSAFILLASFAGRAQIVVIDAGHGYNSDCSNGDGRTETEINTAHNVSHKLKDMIDTTCAWTTHLTRPNNGCGSWVSITQRYIMANNWNADIFLSIHCNAGGGSGTETFWCDLAAPPDIDDENYAIEIQNQMVAYGQWIDRRVVEDDSYLPFHLGVLRNLTMNGCLSEIGFVDTGDSVKLLNNNWRIEFARAYHDGLQNYLGIQCSTPNTLDCANAVQLQCGTTYSGPQASPGSDVNSYGCNNWTETGPERVHSITPLVSGTLTATISNFTGDLDVFILGSCDPSDCLGTVSSSQAVFTNAVAGNTYYIVVDADDGSTSAYDLNVTCSGSAPGQADLTCVFQNLYPSAVSSNDTVEAHVEIQNIGGDTATNYELTFYLSLDSTIDISDSIIGNFLINQHLPLTTLSDTFELAIPSGWNTNAVVIASVDDNAVVNEADENNNQCYQLISISQSPSEILDCGSAINLQCGVTYQGPIANYASEVTTYGCNNWTETGPERVHSITPSFSGTLTATISNFTGDLDVYILGSCDPSDCLGSVSSSQAVFSNAVAGQTYYIVVDADDGSNSAYDLIVDCAIPAQPDLSCTFQSIQPTQVNTNDSILAFLDIHNNGNDTASNYHVTFYISSDSIIDITDSVLGDFIINQHLPLVTLVDSFQMTIPTGWSGNAVIIASVDDNSDVTEADETNNLCYQTISVTQPTVEILDCSNPVVLQCGVPYSGPASNDSSEVTSYGCNNWTETGPERVHQITISDSGSLTATLTNFTGDLDVYILGSCDPSDCLGTVSSSSANYPSAAP